MRRLAIVTVAALWLTGMSAGPAQAITFGEPDGSAHPWVGALVAPIGEGGAPGLVCSGTLISPTVFLTAAHCTAPLGWWYGIAANQVWVTFDPVFGPDATLLPGTYFFDPLFGSRGADNTYDVAVVVLDAAVTGIQPAGLPSAGLLDSLDLRQQRFTAVGYGTVRDSKEGGPHALSGAGERRVASQSALALRPAWLQFSENPATADAGTCYGDSGGPHFLGDTRVVVSITVKGDRFCRATDTTYRLDTSWARAFLGDFVALP